MIEQSSTRGGMLDAIYTMLDREKSLPYLVRDGRFTRRILGDLVWREYREEEQKTFLGMMQSCGICFPSREISTGSGTAEKEYIAHPDLLPQWEGRARSVVRTTAIERTGGKSNHLLRLPARRDSAHVSIQDRAAGG